ncbi:MAG: Asp-tRNA(Asn)/Glu-tRNA(Gln) amidotransferase subunit GatC [Campylobacterales bacterium]
MEIDKNRLLKLEALSKLELDDTKRDEIKEQLSEIVGFVENLNSLDTSHIEATSTTLQGGTPFREDSPLENDIASTILENSPKSEDGFFVVPKIIE